MNDPLFGNKVAFAILAALLLVVGLPLLAEAHYGGHGGGGHGAVGDHGDGHANIFPQFPIEVDFGTSASAAGVEEKMDIGTMMASADMQRGERAAALCGSCHTFNEGGTNLQGPNLWNIVGREIASVDSYGSYSSALKEKSGTWTYDNLSELLRDSQGYAPGTAMRQRIRKDAKRADILAYLGSLSANPVPFPAPLAAAAAELETTEEAANH